MAVPASRGTVQIDADPVVWGDGLRTKQPQVTSKTSRRAMMSHGTRTMTADDLLAMPDDGTGVTIVLVANPQTKTVRDYRSASEIRVFSQGLIDLQLVMAGFRLDGSELFS